MRKALAQNPNLLRTLVGLSVTLIFMLSYAVYGATVSPSVYIYKTEATVDTYDASEADQDVQRFYNRRSQHNDVDVDGQRQRCQPDVGERDGH